MSSALPCEHEKTVDLVPVDASRPIAHIRATGPISESGKERSSRNAIKHGIFSEAILIKGESRAQFNSLRVALWEALRPEGRLEELLIDKLASISWRYRRFLLAETGEIRNQFLEWDQKRNQQDESVADSLRDEECLIDDIQDPNVLKRCLELLAQLREGIKTTGFREERDTFILEKIYGHNEYSRSRLQSEYAAWLDTSKAPEDERVREGYATQEECNENVVEEIEAEVRRLKASHKRRITIRSQRNEIELLRRKIPEIPWLDRVLRYEASLERTFDRTLGQLERIQRLRLGQPVAPRIDVNVST